MGSSIILSPPPPASPEVGKLEGSFGSKSSGGTFDTDLFVSAQRRLDKTDRQRMLGRADPKEKV
jgi:hypothetical protein